jgi:hypothetical protein
LGLPKDRKDRIMDIQNKLLGYCFSVNFSIIEKDTKVLSYEENISNILKSKCIVDIVQKEQTGLTLRPLEALFFERKLLTDYKDIVKYDFYKPQNIFVIGIHDWTDIRSFLSSPFIPVNKKIVDNYNINKWINYFLEE